MFLSLSSREAEVRPKQLQFFFIFPIALKSPKSLRLCISSGIRSRINAFARVRVFPGQ